MRLKPNRGSQADTELLALVRQLGEDSTIKLPSWNLRTARSRFSRLFQRAVEHEPVRISRRGGDAVVVVDERDFLALLQKVHQRMPMVDYFQAVASTGETLEPLPRRSPRDVAELP